MIIINAILKAKQGKEAELKEELLKVIEPSRNEPGCSHYTLHESLDDKGTFVFYEGWQGEEAIKAHIESPHYIDYRKNTEQLIASREVYRLAKLDM